MKGRTNWTQQEDQFLKNYLDNNCSRKWVKISKLLNERFNQKQRSAKQCRQRFINYSRSQKINVLSSQWTQEQNSRLFLFFEKYGPKWTKMVSQFPLKSQNNIKNKFYSSLRKLVRKMNKIRKDYVKKYTKELKYESIVRVLDAPELLISLPIQIKQKALELRHKIICLLSPLQTLIPDSQIPMLIEDIKQFNLQTRSYKLQRLKYNSNRKQNNRNKIVIEKQSSQKLNNSQQSSELQNLNQQYYYQNQTFSKSFQASNIQIKIMECQFNTDSIHKNKMASSLNINPYFQTRMLMEQDQNKFQEEKSIIKEFMEDYQSPLSLYHLF